MCKKIIKLGFPHAGARPAVPLDLSPARALLLPPRPVCPRPSLSSCILQDICNLLPNNQRQCRTCYTLCHILYPVLAAHTSISRMDSNSTSYPCCKLVCMPGSELTVCSGCIRICSSRVGVAHHPLPPALLTHRLVYLSIHRRLDH